MTLTIDSHQFDVLEQFDVITVGIQTDPKTREQVSYIKEINFPNLAKLILSEKKYLVTEDNQDIYVYNGGYFESTGLQQIKNRFNYYLDDLSTKRGKEEVVDFIKNWKYTKRTTLNPPSHLINFKNGVYNLKTGKLEKHDPDKHFFLYQIPVEYKPKAKCPKWEKFIKDVLYQDDIDFVQEYCGYLLFREYKWAVFVLLLGHGGNGKTVFINTLTEILGEKNVKHIELQTLAKNRFAKSRLYQKHANLCAELGTQEVKDASIIKELTGNDTIHAEEKHMKGFDYRNYAKLMFALNKLPDIKDKSKAMRRRLAVLEFPNEFVEGSDECDPDLQKKLLTEKSGIINWLLKGLKQLLKNRHFSDYRDFENVEDYKNLKLDPVKIFIDTHIEKDPNGTIQKQVLYKYFVKFCEEHKHPFVCDSWFSRKFKPLAPMGLEESRPSKKGRKPVWTGIKYIDEKTDGKIDEKTDKENKNLFNFEKELDKEYNTDRSCHTPKSDKKNQQRDNGRDKND